MPLTTNNSDSPDESLSSSKVASGAKNMDNFSQSPEQRLRQCGQKKDKEQPSRPLRDSFFTAPQIPNDPIQAAIYRLLRPLLREKKWPDYMITDFLSSQDPARVLRVNPKSKISLATLTTVIQSLFKRYNPEIESISFMEYVKQNSTTIIQQASDMTSTELTKRVQRVVLVSSWQFFFSLVQNTSWSITSHQDGSTVTMKLNANPSLSLALMRCCEEDDHGHLTTNQLTVTLREWLKMNEIPSDCYTLTLSGLKVIAVNSTDWQIQFPLKETPKPDDFHKICSSIASYITGKTIDISPFIPKDMPITGSLGPNPTDDTGLSATISFTDWLDETIQYLANDFQIKHPKKTCPENAHFKKAILNSCKKIHGFHCIQEDDRRVLSGWFKQIYTVVSRDAFALAKKAASDALEKIINHLMISCIAQRPELTIFKKTCQEVLQDMTKSQGLLDWEMVSDLLKAQIVNRVIEMSECNYKNPPKLQMSRGVFPPPESGAAYTELDFNLSDFCDPEEPPPEFSQFNF